MKKVAYSIICAFACSLCIMAQSVSPFAVHAHLHAGSEYYQVPANLRMMKEAGIHWIRFDFTWPDVEPAQGVWNFDNLDRVVAEAEKLGLSILGIFLHDRPWARPAYQHLDAWQGYVEKVVTRYKDKVRHWEVWNEPDLSPRFWPNRDDGENYARLLSATYEKIKEIDPGISVVYAGTAGIPMSFIEKSYIAGARFDKMSVHPYRPLLTTWEATQRFKDDLDKLRELMAKYNHGGKDIWFTEMGFSSMAGVGYAGKEAFHENRATTGKDWRVAVVCDDEYPVCPTFTGEKLRSLFPTGFQLDTVQILDLRRVLRASTYDAVFFPTSDNIPLHVSNVITPYLERFMSSGGKVYYYTRDDRMFYYGDAAEKEINQAIFLAQTMWLSLRFDIERYFWYEFESPERNFFEREAHFGLTRRGLSPKPAYHAYAAMGRLFPEGSKIDHSVEWRQNDCCVISWKQPDGTRVWAVWAPEGERTVNVKIGKGLRQTFDYLGSPIAGTTESSGTLKVGEAVVYLVGPETLEIQAAAQRRQDGDYAADVVGVYNGNGKLWADGDVQDVVFTLEYVNKTTVKATINAVLPKELRALGGPKTMTGDLTVSPDYELSGAIQLLILNFNGSGSVDPSNKSIKMNVVGKPMGHALNFELKGKKKE